MQWRRRASWWRQVSERHRMLAARSDVKDCHQERIPSIPAAHNSSPTRPSSIQNATLLTFMPPFILIYMYMFELFFFFFFSFKFHSSIHMKNTEKKAKNTDLILKQLLEGKEKGKSVTETKNKGQPLLKIWKNISIKNFAFLLYRGGIPWAESPFWSDAEQYHNFFLSPR